MKLGDNGEAFFVEETEEEFVSPNRLPSLHTLYSGLWCMSQNKYSVFIDSCTDDCCWLDKLSLGLKN